MNTRLADILVSGNRTQLTQAWATTRAAEDFTPLPAGEYVARIISGELFTSRQNTPGYKLAFRVIEGECAGRQFWHDLWLTGPALPMTKRDLGKLGITTLEQLEAPLPQGIRCKVRLALRREDDGNVFNRIRTFEVTGIDAPVADPFAPVDAPAAPQNAGGTAAASPAALIDGVSL